MPVKDLKERLSPLIEWMQKNSDCKRIAVSADDMASLQTEKPSVLQFYGFKNEGDRFTLRGYDLYRKGTP